MPGPGHYNPQRSRDGKASPPGGRWRPLAEGQALNRSVLSAQDERILRDEPGPGSYNVEARLSSKSGAVVSKSERFQNPMAGVGMPGPGHYDACPLMQMLDAVVDQSIRFASVRSEVPGPGQYNLPAAAAAAPGVVAWRPAEEGASRALLSAVEERMLSEMAGPVTSLPCSWRPRSRVRCRLAKLDVPFGFACRASTMPM